MRIKIDTDRYVVEVITNSEEETLGIIEKLLIEPKPRQRLMMENKLRLIKLIKDNTGMDLKNSKDLFDKMNHFLLNDT